MFKNYFIELGNVFKSSGIFFVNNFKKFNLLIWLLIAIQIFLAIPFLYFEKELGFINYPVLGKFGVIMGTLFFFVAFFFMFKQIFKMASIGLEKEEISNSKMIKALLALGIFNCLPFFVFIICLSIAQAFPAIGFYLKIALNLFTYIYYFAMSLSIASIVKWQDRNVFVGIVKSIKIFFKKLGVVVPVFFLFFAIASVVVFALSALIYAVAIYFNFINQSLVNAVHTVVNVYALYIFAGLYIGAQVKLLEGIDE